MTSCSDRPPLPVRLLMAAMMPAWACKCGHGPTRHCEGCGVCHVGQQGKQDPFKEWCGCITPVPLWIRMMMP